MSWQGARTLLRWHRKPRTVQAHVGTPQVPLQPLFILARELCGSSQHVLFQLAPVAPLVSCFPARGGFCVLGQRVSGCLAQYHLVPPADIKEAYAGGGGGIALFIIALHKGLSWVFPHQLASCCRGRPQNLPSPPPKKPPSDRVCCLPVCPDGSPGVCPAACPASCLATESEVPGAFAAGLLSREKPSPALRGGRRVLQLCSFQSPPPGWAGSVSSNLFFLCAHQAPASRTCPFAPSVCTQHPGPAVAKPAALARDTLPLSVLRSPCSFGLPLPSHASQAPTQRVWPQRTAPQGTARAPSCCNGDGAWRFRLKGPVGSRALQPLSCGCRVGGRLVVPWPAASGQTAGSRCCQFSPSVALTEATSRQKSHCSKTRAGLLRDWGGPR